MVNHYEVWWSDSPYAVPGDAGMVKIADVTPGAAPSEATYTDTASGVGNPGVNSFYAVRGVNAGGETAAFSNRAGEFDFGLNGAVATLPIVDHCGDDRRERGLGAERRASGNVLCDGGVWP